MYDYNYIIGIDNLILKNKQKKMSIGRNPVQRVLIGSNFKSGRQIATFVPSMHHYEHAKCSTHEFIQV